MAIVDELKAKANFNSIKVQLELSFVFGFTYNSHLFQFHKGTIRTAIATKKRSASHSFQFHKGTIRTYLRFFQKGFSEISIP